MDNFVLHIIENIHIAITFDKNYILITNIGHRFDCLFLKILFLYQDIVVLFINFNQGDALASGNDIKSIIISFRYIINMIIISSRSTQTLRNFLSLQNYSSINFNNSQDPLRLSAEKIFTIDCFDALNICEIIND